MEGVNTRRRMFLSLSKLGCSLQELYSRKNIPRLIFKASWNNRDDGDKTRSNLISCFLKRAVEFS